MEFINMFCHFCSSSVCCHRLPLLWLQLGWVVALVMFVVRVSPSFPENFADVSIKGQ